MNKLIEDYYEVRKRHDVILGELDDRTGEIITVLINFAHASKKYWWAYDYYESADDDAPLPQKLDGDWFPIYVSTDICIGDSDYSNGFPISFFDMSDDEIVKYLLTEEESYLKRLEKEEKRGERKNKRN